MCYSNIVKIKQAKLEKYGTGVIVAEDIVLTAGHVVSCDGEITIIYQEKIFEGCLSYIDDYIALISVNNKEFKELFYSTDDKLFFTSQEIVPSLQRWKIQGYYSSLLTKHFVEGEGLYVLASPKLYCDYEVGRIEVGALQDYSGLSGAPVICNERAIGIVQIQAFDLDGRLGIGFTSVEKIKNKIPVESLMCSKYIFEMMEAGYNQTVRELYNNKKSEKYIPEIFVEENEYKENLRYFCNPVLFINKSIEDVHRLLDFSRISKYLEREKVSFSDYKNVIDQKNLFETSTSLREDIKHCINVLEKGKEKFKQVDNKSLENKFRQNSAFNNSLKWDLEKICEQVKYIDKRVVVITKNAGQGKTNFLCDFSEKFLIKSEVPVFYFNAEDFVEKPSNFILSKITLNYKWDKEYVKNELIKLWETTGKFIVIVIDGLNENSTLNNFGKYIEESIKELLEYPYLKIIMSTRNEMFEERFGNLSDEIIGNDFCRLDMGQYHKERFKERIFEGYLKFFNVEIVRDTLTASTYNQLANDTLLLRFFCEVNRNKKQVHMYNIYKYSLFTRYYEIKKEEMKKKIFSYGGSLFDRLIEHISEYMLSHQTFRQIDTNFLSEEELKLLNCLLEADVIFKKDIVVKKGFGERMTEIFSFTFDEFRDYCLTRYMVSMDDAQKHFPDIWTQMHESRWSIVEGVEKYVFFLARTKFPDIESIIKLDPNYEKLYWDNIWNIEECHIKDEDLDLWLEQFYSGGKYIERIAGFLLNRRDRKYFKRTSIDLLFGMFINLSAEPWKYEKIIRALFPMRNVNVYGYGVKKGGGVWCCHDFLETIEGYISVSGISGNYRDVLRLSLFIYHLIPNDVNKLWKKLCAITYDQVLEILVEYNDIDSKAIFVRQNLRDIIVAIGNADIEKSLGFCDNLKKSDCYKAAADKIAVIWAKGL